MTDMANEAGLRADARREKLVLAALTAPAFLILGALLFIPVGWLFGVGSPNSAKTPVGVICPIFSPIVSVK